MRALLFSTITFTLALPAVALDGDEGCTPGYWRNHLERWDGLDDDDFTETIVGTMPFNDTFNVTSADSGLSDLTTLHDATWLGSGGLDALARHAAAALANADSVEVCYPLTIGEVIDLYQDAVFGIADVEATKDIFEGHNELGCPLSNSTDPDVFCIADEGDCPCGNEALLSGCANSTGLGARLDWEGSTSVVADDLVLVTEQLPPNTATLMLMADDLRRDMFMDGLLCVGGPMSKIYRIPPILMSDANGRAVYDGGIVALSGTQPLPIPGGIQAGETWYIQTYFRDMGMGTCGTGANTSNALAVTFTP